MEILLISENVYKQQTMKKSAVYEWIVRFKCSRENVNDYVPFFWALKASGDHSKCRLVS